MVRQRDSRQETTFHAEGELTMKKQAYTMIAMIVLFGCTAVSVRAQCGGMPTVTNIPFQFSTGKATLPAGEYKLTCFDPNGRVVLISSTDGKTKAAMQMVSVSDRAKDGARLLFHRYGSRYFLVQAWGGGNTGLQLPTTHAERTVARELAGITPIKPKTETIVLNASH
jgi:hypothetical protein